MPPAARVNDPTSHGPPTNPGPGSPNVQIGFMAAWRALPAAVGAAVDAISDNMKAFMDKSVLNPGSAGADLGKIAQSLIQGGAKAAAAGKPAALGTAAGQLGTLISTNVTLTSAWTAASAAPGGQPAADQAYTQGIKAAAAAAASAVLSAIAGMADMHICPLPCPVPPHGPGFVTKGSKTVLINNLPAARQNDKIMEACGGNDPIAMGCSTVLIGDDEGSGGGGGAAATPADALSGPAQSAAAAMSAAANSGTPLIEITPSCGELSDSITTSTAAPTEATGPQTTATQCRHPTNARCTLQDTGLGYGLRVGLTWESPTGNLADLSTCHVTEHITRSAIRNPPFGPADGSTLPESGQSRRLPEGEGIPAVNGQGTDTHRFPESQLRSPPSVGSYTVEQSYDYNCSACNSGWVPFAHYRIRYSVYQTSSGSWRFRVYKTGPGGPFESDEAVP